MAFQNVTLKLVEGQKDVLGLLQKLVDIAGAKSVFGEPVKSGDYTVITASEIQTGMGMGFGYGMGADGDLAETDETPNETGSMGGGGGGGGGGGVRGRPVAAIIVGPQGARVEPIVDVTTVSLAFFTMFGSMIFTLLKMKKATKHD